MEPRDRRETICYYSKGATCPFPKHWQRSPPAVNVRPGASANPGPVNLQLRTGRGAAGRSWTGGLPASLLPHLTPHVSAPETDGQGELESFGWPLVGTPGGKLRQGSTLVTVGWGLSSRALSTWLASVQRAAACTQHQPTLLFP